VAEDLQQKVRRLSKLASVSQNLHDAQEDLERARKRAEDLERQLQRQHEAAEGEKKEHQKEIAKLKSEIEATREELKNARRQLARLEKLVPEGTADEDAGPRSSEEQRLAILLDQANLAATAAVSFKRKVNFAALLDRLKAGRRLIRAVAFVVDNGGTFFDSFCDTLRKSGWELRIKRPKVFADGTTKADWDMGIAMEAIAIADEADAMVLVSGDGDFAPLLKQLRRRGLRVEVAAYPEGLALELVNAADAVARLDQSTLE
jgi:uncharacterized LabA/DUF88 family protein